MHCASSPPRPHRRRSRSWAIAALAAALFGPLCAAPARADADFVYCLKDGGAKIFAGRSTAGGSLRFGLSVWSPAGHNLSVFGTAQRRDGGWEYDEAPTGPTAAERCRLTIAPASGGGLTVSAAADATCASHGGANTSVGTIRFPHGALEGPVTTELDDSEAFQKAGKCVGAPQHG